MIQTRHLRRLGHFAALIVAVLMFVFAPLAIRRDLSHGRGEVHGHLGSSFASGFEAAISAPPEQTDCEDQEKPCQSDRDSSCCAMAGCPSNAAGVLPTGHTQDIPLRRTVAFRIGRMSIPSGLGTLPLIPPPRGGA